VCISIRQQRRVGMLSPTLEFILDRRIAARPFFCYLSFLVKKPYCARHFKVVGDFVARSVYRDIFVPQNLVNGTVPGPELGYSVVQLSIYAVKDGCAEAPSLEDVLKEPRTAIRACPLRETDPW